LLRIIIIIIVFKIHQHYELLKNSISFLIIESLINIFLGTTVVLCIVQIHISVVSQWCVSSYMMGLLLTNG
jgi:hypothetical protein